jgi:hypothetical protein
MTRLLILIAAALPLAAQPVIVAGPVVDDVTHSGARVTWATSPAAAPKLECGTAPGGPYPWVSSRTNTSVVQGLWLGGWAPASSAYCRVCSTSGGETCSPEFTITTAPHAGEHPEKPEAAAELDISMPDGPYGQPFLIDSACTNLQSTLDSITTLSGDLNYEVRIPAQNTGTACRGRFVLRERPNHTGWIVIRPDVPDETLPPVGSRLTEEFRPNLAKIISNAMGLRPDSFTGWPACISLATTGTSKGEFAWVRNIGGNPLFRATGSTGVGPPLAVTGQSNSTPLRLTVPGHGLQTGDVVIATSSGTVRASEGLGSGPDTNCASNGRWGIVVIDQNTIELQGSAWVSGTVSSIAKNLAWHHVQADAGSGTQLPAGGQMGDWFIKTDEPWGERLYWYTKDGWTRMAFVDPINNNQRTSAIYSDFGTKAVRYRFVGLEITHEPHVHQDGWEQQNHLQGSLAQLVHFGVGTSDVVIDRCDVRGRGFPDRLAFGIISYADRFGLVDSRVFDMNRWLHRPSAGGFNLEAYAVYIRAGSRGRIENNYLRSNGITLFFSDTGNNYNNSVWTGNTHATDPPSDWVIRRNHLEHLDEHRMGSPVSDGRDYFLRHHLEWKRGVRSLVEGNIFDLNWADVVQGAPIMITPTSGGTTGTTVNSASGPVVTVASSTSRLKPGDLVYISGSSVSAYDGIWTVQQVGTATHELWDPVFTLTLLNGPIAASCSSSCGNIQIAAGRAQVADIDIRFNTIMRAPRVVEMIGRHNWSSGQAPTKRTQRVRILGNLVYDIDGRSFASGGYVSSSATIGTNSRRGYLLASAYNAEDVRIERNTVIDLQGLGQHVLFHDASDDTAGTNEGLLIARNLWLSASPVENKLYTNNGLTGSNLLNARWTRHPGPDWVVRDNVHCCGIPAGGEPPGNFFPAAAGDLKLQMYDPSDSVTKLYRKIRYALRHDSPYLGGGDGQPGEGAGVDLERIESIQGLTKNVRVRAITASGATVSYLAPDEAECHVEVSTSAVWGTGIRQGDGGGNRVRNVSFSGLSSVSNYHYRVLCAVPAPETRTHPGGVFRTR